LFINISLFIYLFEYYHTLHVIESTTSTTTRNS
jgi:hypothetical protein